MVTPQFTGEKVFSKSIRRCSEQFTHTTTWDKLTANATHTFTVTDVVTVTVAKPGIYYAEYAVHDGPRSYRKGAWITYVDVATHSMKVRAIEIIIQSNP